MLLCVGVVMVLFAASAFQKNPDPFHTPEEIEAFEEADRSPIDSTEYFLGSNNCKGCHGFDTTGLANVNSNGEDINLFDDWQATMMALSTKDPLWRAQVSHEILVNPGHADALQDKCTSCHAPMGHFTAHFHGAQHYTLADLYADTLGLDGISCTGCHTIGDPGVNLKYSGNIFYDTLRKEYGPFFNPVLGPMQLYVGLEPAFSGHVSASGICASCHTLITETADLSGNLTGGTFVEQATFHEWKNSIYNPTQPCQSCHMPQIKDEVKIANGYINLAPRSPFNLHQFAGANTTMLQLLKNNKSLLGIDVPDENFDSTIALTFGMLQQKSVDMTLQTDSIAHDTLYLSVNLKNKAGHKFPSGYPSRRAFLSVVVTDGTDTLYRNGMLQADYDVQGHDASTEPHYNIIRSENDVQIYELAMADVGGNRTTILERAATAIKDNRLAPEGFTTSHPVYDTVQIVGAASTDPDFNKNGVNEGTGRDIVHYHIKMNGFSGNVQVHAALYYQTIPPRWVQAMFALNSPEIDSFKNMFNAADRSPVLVASDALDTVNIPLDMDEVHAQNSVRLFPNPTTDGSVTIAAPQNISRIEIWDGGGRKVNELRLKKSTETIRLPNATGVYFLRIHSGNKMVVKRVMKM